MDWDLKQVLPAQKKTYTEAWINVLREEKVSPGVIWKNKIRLRMPSMNLSSSCTVWICLTSLLNFILFFLSDGERASWGREGKRQLQLHPIYCFLKKSSKYKPSIILTWLLLLSHMLCLKLMPSPMNFQIRASIFRRRKSYCSMNILIKKHSG